MTDEPEDAEGDNLKPHWWKPGQSGNPKGRPKGSRNKLGEAFVDALQEDFAKHGVKAIETVRTDKPEHYLKVIASILPKELNVNVNETDALTDDELIQRLRRLDDTIRPFLALAGEAGAGGSDSQETAH